MTGLGRLFRHRLWALLAPRISVQSSLDRTRRDAILANRSQSKLRYVERPSPPSSQNRSDSPALGRLSPGRGLSQDGNRSSFGTHPESATGWPSVYPGARHRGIRPDPQDLASAQFYRRPQLPEAHPQPAESRRGAWTHLAEGVSWPAGGTPATLSGGSRGPVGRLRPGCHALILWTTRYIGVSARRSSALRRSHKPVVNGILRARATLDSASGCKGVRDTIRGSRKRPGWSWRHI